MITFSSYTIHVKNLAASLAFYKEALGLVPDSNTADEKCAVLWDGVTQFRMTLCTDPCPETGCRAAFLSFLADEAEALRARHAAMGCLVEDADEGGWLIEDPDGYRIRILPAPKP